MEFREVFLAEDRDGDGVGEDKRLRVVELVRCATQSYAECGSGGAGFFHGEGGGCSGRL